jgi:hypothetical protein
VYSLISFYEVNLQIILKKKKIEEREKEEEEERYTDR